MNKLLTHNGLCSRGNEMAPAIPMNTHGKNVTVSTHLTTILIKLKSKQRKQYVV